MSRGLEEASRADQNSRDNEDHTKSDPAKSEATEQSSGEAEPLLQSEVTERGISPFKMAKPSTGIQSAMVTPPAAASPIMTLPPSQVGAAATQGQPGPQIGAVGAGRMSLPSNTKSAVLSVQLPFGTQLPGR